MLGEILKLTTGFNQIHIEDSTFSSLWSICFGEIFLVKLLLSIFLVTIFWANFLYDPLKVYMLKAICWRVRVSYIQKNGKKMSTKKLANIFLNKTKFDQKNCQNKIWQNKFDQKNWTKKHLAKIKVAPKKNWPKKLLPKSIIWPQKNVCQKTNFQKKISQKNENNIFCKKNCPNNFFPKYKRAKKSLATKI